MKINKLEPQGFCGGVINALSILNEAINNPSTPKPIYLLGPIIHNSYVNNEYIDKGLTILDGKNKLKDLDTISTGTVIISSHGVGPSIYDKINSKGLNIIDATCPNVKIIHTKITNYLNKGYTCIYIGNKGHAEHDGVINISSSIISISNLNEIDDLNIVTDKIYITNQTTLSLYDLKNIYDKLKSIYPHAIIDDKICNATTVRQKSVINQEKVDLCIIVGDKTSSNTKKLARACELIGINSTLCEDLGSLDKELLKNINSVSITSGASTPSYLVDEIISYLNTL